VLSPEAGRVRRRARPRAPEACPCAAGQTFTLPHALHLDLILVAEPRRTMVSRTDRQSATPWRVHSVPDLTAKIEQYLAAHNHDPKPCFGPQPPTTSWPRSPADASHSKQSITDETNTSQPRSAGHRALSVRLPLHRQPRGDQPTPEQDGPDRPDRFSLRRRGRRGAPVGVDARGLPDSRGRVASTHPPE